MKLSLVLYRKDEQFEVTQLQACKLGSNYQEIFDFPPSELEKFLEDYLKSSPSKKLTRQEFSKHFYNEKEYEWVTPDQQ